MDAQTLVLMSKPYKDSTSAQETWGSHKSACTAAEHSVVVAAAADVDAAAGTKSRE